MFDTQSISEFIDQSFLEEVKNGLSQPLKRLSSKYFYNEVGDKLFQEIMALDEYYLTRAEYEIFTNQKMKILDQFSPNGEPFNLVEFGAGDGYKTKVLLKYFADQNVDFEYLPIDISQNALNGLEDDLAQSIPNLKSTGLQGDYFEVLEELSHSSKRKNIVLFLGSNIGNFSYAQAIEFLTKLRSDLNEGDMILIGIDLKKDPKQIVAAYDDDKGVTAAFNLNLLTRINEELDGNFELSKFKHQATYDPQSGECRSYLLSLEDQKVIIDGQEFKIEKWEPIHTEVSKKYSKSEIHDLAVSSGFIVSQDLTDQKGYFVDSIWEAI